MRFFQNSLHRDERRVTAVPLPAACLLGLALLGQITWSVVTSRTPPVASDLAAPPGVARVRISSLDESQAYAKLMNLMLQSHDNQPGVSLPFRQLDYALIEAWLARILELDPQSQYPLLAASRLYGAVDDPARQRRMLEFVYRQFLLDPNRRWQWLAHAAYIARHQLRDMALALRFAKALRRHATSPLVPAWARQMEIFLRADLNEIDTAKLLLGCLLASGEVTNASEYRFLAGRLAELEGRMVASPK